MIVHILNQYMWPDCAPGGIYAEQLGVCLQQSNYEVILVSTDSCFRRGIRPAPIIRSRKLEAYKGKRGAKLLMLAEYQSVFLAFQRYIKTDVRENDIVICTSAPPQAIHLIDVIRRKKAHGVYWLQDYYPDLLRGSAKIPPFVWNLLARHWNKVLQQWHRVVRISSNLRYQGANTTILRNWPTLNLGQPRPFEPKTASYFGNLGYGHCQKLFVEACTELHQDGYTVNFVGDGPNVSQFPSWINLIHAPDEQALIDLYWRAEVHLIAADPEVTGAVFPSKYWNSRGTGRRIVTSGFCGTMLAELNEVNAMEKLPSPAGWLPLLQNL